MVPFLTIMLFGFTMGFKNDDFTKLSTIYNEIRTTYEQFSQNKSSLKNPKFLTITKRKLKHLYDFIIIGSGSAGSVLANRLSENSQWKILLIEAGKSENLLAQIPLVAPALALTDYNWNNIAEYQVNMSSGFNQRKMLWPRGKALGGSSVINFMIYTRGNRFDYDRWAAQGNPGWSYNDVLPYYIKSENSKLVNSNKNAHGKHGYLSVEDIYQSQLVESFIEGSREMGLHRFDYNANSQSFGVSPIQATVKGGRRHSVAKAFLYPVQYRKNLHILTSAFVTRILIDPEHKRVYGVEYKRFGIKFKVMAKKEVILSAGTFNSPQLLMLAGIGPRNHLHDLGIPVIKDLPVGQNLQDHITFPGLCFIINRPLSLSTNFLLNETSILNFLFNGKGPYTSLGGVEAIAYIKTNVSQETEDIPDIELLFIDGSLSTDFGLFNRRWMNIRDDVYNTVFAPTHHLPTFTIFPMLLHPKSKGYLRLNSKNPYNAPLFYGNYFTDPEENDINTLLSSIRYIQKLISTKAFQKLGTRINPRRLPDCVHFDFDSDNYWKCALRSISVTLHHQVGTVKMGPSHDQNSVVNHELKVHGIKGLRVADCSVIPFALSAHTNAPSIMIGEKAADMIKNEWKIYV